MIYTYQIIEDKLNEIVDQTLAMAGMHQGDVDWLIPHQANKRIIDVAAERCGISEDKVLINIDKYGNTTAGTIPIALNEANNNNQIKNGDYVLLSAFGAGFTWGSMLIKWGSE